MPRTTPLPAVIALTSAAALTAALGPARPAGAASTYLALGDSLTRGETDLIYAPTAAPGGYVGIFDAFLAGSNGGVAPNVIDLGIDGETAESFFSGSGRLAPVLGRGDAALVGENLNYNTTPALPQYQELLNTIAAQQATGNTISTVTITLGTNDLLSLSNVSGATAASVPADLATFQTNYSTVLGDIRQALPNTKLLVLGSYNPFPADPTSPAATFANAGGTQLNAIIQSLAGQYGGSYVDIATPFVGHEAADTYLAQLPANATVTGQFGGTLPAGNIHPNAVGYQLIANQVEAANTAVPEPPGLTLLGVGTVPVLGLLWARRKRAV